MFGMGRQAVCILSGECCPGGLRGTGSYLADARQPPWLMSLGAGRPRHSFLRSSGVCWKHLNTAKRCYHVRENDKGADVYYQLAFQKAEMLQSEVQSVRKRLAAEKQQRVAELAAQAEEEQLMRALRKPKNGCRAWHRKIGRSGTIRAEKKQGTRRSLPTSYTVRRGETFPRYLHAQKSITIRHSGQLSTAPTVIRSVTPNGSGLVRSLSYHAI